VPGGLPHRCQVKCMQMMPTLLSQWGGVPQRRLRLRANLARSLAGLAWSHLPLTHRPNLNPWNHGASNTTSTTHRSITDAWRVVATCRGCAAVFVTINLNVNTQFHYIIIYFATSLFTATNPVSRKCLDCWCMHSESSQVELGASRHRSATGAAPRAAAMHQPELPARCGDAAMTAQVCVAHAIHYTSIAVLLLFPCGACVLPAGTACWTTFCTTIWGI
jgi:hypothetical protein